MLMYGLVYILEYVVSMVMTKYSLATEFSVKIALELIFDSGNHFVCVRKRKRRPV